MDGEWHVVVVLLVLALALLVAKRHHFDKVKRFLLGFLHRHGRVCSARRAKPGPVHDGGRRIHRGVIGRLKHGDARKKKKKNTELR